MKNMIQIDMDKKVTSNVSSTRIVSFVLDWIIGGTIANIPAVVIYALLSKSGQPLTSMYQFESIGLDSKTTILILSLCILVGFMYYVVIPWKIYPGQTIGKKLTKLEIVSITPRKMTFNRYFIRQFIFLILIEGIATPISTQIRVILTTVTRIYTDSYLEIIWTGITLISIAILFLNRQNMSLHDLCTKTVVIKKLK